MKRFIATVLAVLMIGGATAQEAFPDIPAGHWAGEAVARIADLGIVIGFPDGTFRGNESFTRYQAALVVSRMLDVIDDRIEAAQAMTQEDIVALRNALQELASDVAAQEARLGAVEDAVAGLADDVTADRARIEALEAAIEEVIDPDVLRDLQNQLEALRAAVDTAQATADAAEALATQALDAVDALEQQVRDNAAAIAALNELVAMLEEDIARLEIPDEIDPEIFNRLDRAEADIANIREFTVLLRRDQVALTERVAALEERVDEHDELIADLDDRLTRVEEDMLIISGSIALEYYVGRGSGPFGNDFDVDRVFGRHLNRDIGPSAFTTGATAALRDVDRPDMPQAAGQVTTTLTINFGFGVDRAGVSAPRELQTFDAVLELELRPAVGLVDEDGDTFTGHVFSVTSLRTTFSPIGEFPLTFEFGEEPRASFTPYVFDTRMNNHNTNGGGFVLTVGAPDFLAFLDPTLTVAYGADADLDDAYYRAARLTLSPFDGVAVGGSFAQRAHNAAEHEDVFQDNVTTTVFGADASISIAMFDLLAEFAQSSTFDRATDETSMESTIIYAILGVDGEDLPIITEIEANFRSMPADFQGLTVAPGQRDLDPPFQLDQMGFGARAALELFIVDVEAYFDSYTTNFDPFSTEGDDTVDSMAFGAGARAELFAGFGVGGFFKSASVDGEAANFAVNRGFDLDFDIVDFSTQPTFSNSATGRPDSGDGYVTGFGARVDHDGDADNALIPGLDLYFQFNQLGHDFGATLLDARAEFDLSVAFITLSPYAGFTSFSEAAENDNNNEVEAQQVDLRDNTTTIRVGTTVETDPFEFFLRPSLEAAVNFRTTSHSNEVGAGEPGEYTATELQFAVGLTLNEFLFDNSELSVRYGQYTGTNVLVGHPVDAGARTGVGETDINRGDAAMSTSGYEVVWNYWDLEFAYGVYTFQHDTTIDDGVSVSQAFRISYEVTF